MPNTVFAGDTGDGMMPRYFFHSLNGHIDHDIDGTLLPNDEAAKTQAVIYTAELLRNDPSFLWDGNALRIKVTGEMADVLFVIVTQLENP